VQDDAVPSTAVPDQVGDEGDRLHGGMEFKIAASRGVQAVDAWIVQNICAVPTLTTKSKVINVGRGAVFEYGNQLMLRAIEATLSGIGFVPRQNIFKLGVVRVSSVEQCPQMSPVHEHIVYRAVPAELGCQAKEAVEEIGVGGFGHFARGHSKFTGTNFSTSHRMTADLDVVGRIGHDHLCEVAAQEPLVVIAAAGIATHQIMSPEFPKVAGLWHCRAIKRESGHSIRGVICCACYRLPVHDEVDLAGRKASQLNLKIDVDQPFEMLP